MSSPHRILAIETSSPRLSLAVGTDTDILKEYQGPLEWRHAENLFNGMAKLLAKVRWPVQSLTGVLVSTGPGSFTGIRIGLAAARALGQALRIPVAGVPSLKTIARGVLKPGEAACILIDALRGDVFTGMYRMNVRGAMMTDWKESRMALSDLARKLKPFRKLPLTLAGDAASLYKGELSTLGRRWHFKPLESGYPRAAELMRIGSHRLTQVKAASYQNVVPLYLRSAAAQERRRK